MATSGSTTVKVTDYNNLVFSWQQTMQSPTDNTTNISWSLVLTSGSAGKITSTASKKWIVGINGTTYSGSTSVAIGNSTSKTLASGTATIPHNADGTMTFVYTFSQVFAITFGGSYVGVVSGAGTGVLNTISQKSTITCESGALGESKTIKINRASSSFTHTITYSCGSASGTICTKDTRTSIPWTPPLSLAKQNASGTSVKVKLAVTTYNGSTYVGEYSLTITCGIPDSVSPTLSISVADASDAYSIVGAYVQNVSRLAISLNASGSNGSSISSYQVTVDGKTYSSKTVETGALSKSGTITISAKVTDSRGRTKTASTSISVLAYSYPKISSASAYRSDASGNAVSNGGYITVKFSSIVYALNNKNNAWYKVQYKKSTLSSYTTKTIDSLTGTFSVSNAKYTFAAEDAAYNVILTVGDRFRSVPITVFGQPVLGKLFSFLKKSGSIVGIAIGKKAETEGVLDIGYKLLLSGGIYGEEEGDKDGWHYKKYSNGVAECWKTIEHSTALSTSWGSLYYGTATSRQTYPFTFVSKPVETVSLQAQTYQGIIFPEKDGYGVNTASATARYNICRPSSITTATKFYISFNVKGKWK